MISAVMRMLLGLLALWAGPLLAQSELLGHDMVIELEPAGHRLQVSVRITLPNASAKINASKTAINVDTIFWPRTIVTIRSVVNMLPTTRIKKIPPAPARTSKSINYPYHQN